MKPKLSLKQRLTNRLDDFRLQTAQPDALMQSSFLGLIVGILAGSSLVVFILIIDLALTFWLPGHKADNFEDLTPLARLIAPMLGASLLAIIFTVFSKDENTVGVVNVLERLRYHQGYLRLRGFILQFIGASIALVSGQSLGREGPAIHLGAYLGSFVGQSIGLPNNAIRTLVSCGAAAAISAAFNTPLAGVIFAMEIIMVEYTIASFIPIIIAAVAATTISRSVLGDDPLVTVIDISSLPVTEMPYVVLIGILVGLASTLFSLLVRRVTHWTKNYHLAARFLMAGTATGLIAFYIPQVMGLGYDTLNAAVLGTLSAGGLFIIMLAKLVATSISVGCGMPAGLIGPSLVIGAVGGALMAVFLDEIAGVPLQNTSVYALVGMASMMGACLHAPLAALTAVFEITANHSIIWPSMIAIVIAQLVSRQIFKQPPVYDMLLSVRGLDYFENPVTQSLQRTGVAKAMSQNYRLLEKTCTSEAAMQAIKDEPQWICIQDAGTPIALLRGVDLIQYLDKEHSDDTDTDTEIDLLQIPAKRLQISLIDIRATLAKARDTFKQDSSEALCITHWNKNAPRYVYGILTREQFDTLYMR